MTTLLEMSGVSVSFDGFKAINNLSFQIGEPELRAIIGPNGAGKTTFMDIITGKTRPDEGRVLFGEKSVSLLKMSESQIARAGVGRKFQKPTVFEAQTVRENLAMALANKRGPFDVLFYRKSKRGAERIEEIAEMIFLSDHLSQKAAFLSHGQKQWLEIGMLLIQDPELLMLDEPVAGMSVAERKKTAELLNRIIADRSVIVIEHDMGFVADIATRVTVLHQGKVLSEGSMEHVQNDPRVVEVYLGH